MSEPGIRWPDEYRPEVSRVFVSNRISIAASPEAVWQWLTFAQTWPEWYANSSNMQLEEGDGHLREGSTFQWRTFGVGLESHVREFVPYERLAWDARSLGVNAYHAWLIIPTETGCEVLTEETQNGFLARLGNLVLPKRMYFWHQKWLEGLKEKAESPSDPVAKSSER